MGEPCESCRMTVSTVRRVGTTVTGEVGQVRFLGEVLGDLGGADDFFVHLFPRHTAQRCRSARTLREAAEATLGATDAVTVAPGCAPGTLKPDDGWLQLRVSRRHVDGRLVSAAHNVTVKLAGEQKFATSLGRHLDEQLNAKVVA